MEEFVTTIGKRPILLFINLACGKILFYRFHQVLEHLVELF
jgi:hypothetical protein